MHSDSILFFYYFQYNEVPKDFPDNAIPPQSSVNGHEYYSISTQKLTAPWILKDDHTQIPLASLTNKR